MFLKIRKVLRYLESAFLHAISSHVSMKLIHPIRNFDMHDIFDTGSQPVAHVFTNLGVMKSIAAFQVGSFVSAASLDFLTDSVTLKSDQR